MAQPPSDPQEPKRDSSDKIDLSRTPKPKSGSFGDGDWLNEIPDPPALPEGSGNYPSFVDADFDIHSLFPGPAPSPDTDVVDLGAKPDGQPLSPASGWFDSGVLKTPPPVRPKSQIPPAAPSDGDSDIFSSGRAGREGDSNAFNASPYPTPSSSNIFDAPTEGSSRFFNPTDGTEEVREAAKPAGGERNEDAEDDLFLAFDQPPSELFTRDPKAPGDGLSGLMDDGSNEVNSLLDQLNLNFPTPTGRKVPRAQAKAPPKDQSDEDSSPDFNIVDNGSSGSNLFRDDDDQPSHFMGEPAEHAKADGPDSTIFQRSIKDPSSINLDQIPMMGSSDDKGAVDYTGEDVDGTESIFQTGPQRADSGIPYPEDSAVDFNLPKRKTKKVVTLEAGAAVDDDDGEIDWTMPSGAEQPALSARHAAGLAGVTDQFDVFGRGDDEEPHLSEPLSGIYSGSQSPSKIFPRPSLSVNSSGSRTSLEGPRSGTLPAPSPKMGGSGIFEMRSAHTIDVNADGRPAGKSGKLGWLVGTAAGLLAGVGLSGGAYLAFADKPDSAVRTTVAGTREPSAVTAGPEKFEIGDARKFLAVGDPARALPAYESAGDGASPLVLAERGKARWLFRIRELAAEKKPPTVDDPLLKQALTDLEQFVAKAETFSTPDEQRTVVEAALRIGLTKEITGDAAGASAYYVGAAKRFPKAKIVFDTAVRRIKAMPVPAGGKVAVLLPQQAEELARLVVPVLFLIQSEVAAGDVVEAEAGFLFWEAINEASVNNFAKARTLILKARAAHDTRRLLLAGRGLNSLSDPMEQIFLRCCNDLNAFWTVKEQLYTHPTAGPIFAKAGLNRITAAIDELAAAGTGDPKIALELNAAKAKLAAAEKATTAMEREYAATLKFAETKAKEAAEMTKKELAALQIQIQAAQDMVLERTKATNEANDAAVQAKKNLTTATDGLDKVVLALKSAKLVEADADAATVLKNLPEVMRKLATAADSTDAKKAAETLTAAKKELDAAKIAMTEKDRTTTVAKEQLETAKAELQTKLAAAKAENEKALIAAKAEAARMVDVTKEEAAKTIAAAKAETTELRASLAVEVKKGVVAAETAAAKKVADLEAAQAAQLLALQRQLQLTAKRLEMQEEEHRKQVADARAGAVVPLSGAEIYAREKAASLYNKGVEAYFAGRPFEAEPLLQRAVELNAADARSWYFLGLSKYGQGKADAVEAFKRGAEQESRNLPGTREVNVALERVQGAARTALKPYRP